MQPKTVFAVLPKVRLWSSTASFSHGAVPVRIELR